MDLCTTIVLAIVIGLFIIWLLQCDADLTVLFWSRFGKSPKAALGGQVVWITGASSGIGEYLAYALAKAGCKLVLSARRQEELERVKQLCLVKGKVTDSDIMVLPLDMLKMDTHKDATDKVLDKFGLIDVLINNAGRSQRAFATETALEVDKQVMELNLFSVISLTKAVVPHMIKRKTGHIVVTSSIAGKVGAPMSASYNASKFALQGWFDTFAIENASNNIGMTLACPGPVFSNFLKSAFTGEPDKELGGQMSPTERRMPTERCAELMVVALANKIEEAWITKQPILLLTYIVVYMPWLGRKLGKTIGVKLMNQMREGHR